jgi:hypothetical protein
MYENEPQARPVPASAQHDRVRRENIWMLGTVEEIVPAREAGLGPTSDADRLLRMLPAGFMLGVCRTPHEDPRDWQPVIWLGLPQAHDFTPIRSSQFREYLAQLFYTQAGKVLKGDRREELVVVICGLVTAAWERRRAEYNEHWGRDRDAATNADAHEADALASQMVTGGSA